MHAAEEIEDGAAALLVVSIVVLDAVVVVGEGDVGVGFVGGVEGEVDVAVADAVIPEGFAEAAGLFVGGEDGFVDDVPGLELAAEVSDDLADVIGEDGADVGGGGSRGEPLGNGVVPDEGVSAKLEVMGAGEGEERLRGGVVEAVLGGAEGRRI